MSTTLTLPKDNVPIGRVTINGVAYEVVQSSEIARFFFDIVRRAGGVTAQSNVDLQLLAEKLAAINPPSEVAAQAAQRLAEDLHAQIASLRGSIDDALQRCDELAARIEGIPSVPDLTMRVAQIEDRLQ